MRCRLYLLFAASLVAFLIPVARARGQSAPGKSGDENFPALESIVAKAQQGSAEEQTKLGDYCLAKGDSTNAVAWYHRAAEQGETQAMLSLASCYLTGRGVPINRQEAARWLRQASIQIGDKTNDLAQAAIATDRTCVTGLSTNVPSPAAAQCRPNRCERIRVLERVEPAIVQIEPALRPALCD